MNKILFPGNQEFSPSTRRFLQSLVESNSSTEDRTALIEEKIYALEQNVYDLDHANPLIISYDESNYVSHTVDSSGNALIDAVGTVKIGDTSNHAQFATDGTLTLVGTATVFKDELGRLSSAKLTSPGGHLIQDDAEGSYYYKSTATTSDYLWINIQLNHDRKHGANLFLHLHWWQTSATIPNWLVQYRYQKQGAAKTTAWTSIKYSAHVFTYTSGTLNQITSFPAITPPAGDGISDIIQIRLIRDTSNASTLFSGTDGLSGNVYLVDADVHKECDTLGSKEEYIK